jgi:hypothetical protein
VDVVDEYGLSAEKMKRFITQQSAGRFQFILKLDDDAVCDLGRIVCSLAAFAQSAQAGDMCRRIGLAGILPFPTDAMDEAHGAGTDSPGPLGSQFWWSNMRQYPMNFARPAQEYHISPDVARRYRASHRCVDVSGLQLRDGTWKSWEPWRTPQPISPTFTAEHAIYQVFGFGGSHVLSAPVVRWWAAHPEQMSTDIWMEDVAFGLWFEAYVMAHPRGSSFYVHDPRWMESTNDHCVAHALAMNGGTAHGSALVRACCQYSTCVRACAAYIVL